ncbi:porin [Ideonella sp. DXS29W]|uniref:Porin n=1 Tax=Ideonella lacteola TaxID=2984193 RepID=A0ABU9BRP3_9BURK
MKKQIALGLLAAVAAGGAFAQSSVTVYGRLNVTVESVKHGDEDRQGEVNNNSSRIGFKGTEDLGGGLKAGFQIEHGFDPTTGTAASTFWGRQAEVNLAGNFGQIRLGTFTPDSYYATSDYIGMHNHETGDSSDALYGFSTYVTQNKVGYVTPNLSGFQAFISVAEGVNNPDPTPDLKKTWDLAAYYDAGPLHLGAGYSKRDEEKQFAVRGLYEFGAFTVGGLVQRVSEPVIGDRTYFRVSGMYAFGANELHLNVGRTGEYSDLKDTDALQWTVGYNYNLSKRTKVYGYYTKIADDSGIYGGDFNAFALGIRHNF